jgi:hypothetical protein
LFQVSTVGVGEGAGDVAEDFELEAADFGFPEGFGGEEGGVKKRTECCVLRTEY